MERKYRTGIVQENVGIQNKSFHKTPICIVVTIKLMISVALSYCYIERFDYVPGILLCTRLDPPHR